MKMNAQSKTVVRGTDAPESSEAATIVRRPVLAQRKGRGRLGGSRFLDLLVQRARFLDRRVKVLDGDLRSRTLAELYPAIDGGGKPVRDGASAPKSEELPAMKTWLFEQLDEMVEDRVSRVLDLGGGDRVMQEFVRELPMASYCEDMGIDLVSLYMLGPDPEDFRHVREVIKAEGGDTTRIVLVMNEGVIRVGQSVDGVFDPLIRDPDMKALMADGARGVIFRRLSCMELVQTSGQSYYDIVKGVPGLDGQKQRSTTQHMVKTWLSRFEAELKESHVGEWLP